MSSHTPFIPLNCSCWKCVHARKEATRNDLIAFAKSGGPPVPLPQRIDPAELALALRDREATFSEDVIPSHTTVLPPKELYGEDMWSTRLVPRHHEEKPWSAVEAAKDEKHPMRGAPMAAWVGTTHPGRRLRATYGRPLSLNGFAKIVHHANQHWWHDPATGAKVNRNMGEMLMLVVSEIAECMEGERKDLMDTHLPHRKMAEVELADAVIRLADIVGARGVDLDTHIADVSTEMDVRRLPDNKGEALHRIASALSSIRYYEGYAFARKLARCFARIETYAKMHSYDLWSAVEEKRQYNRHRADHKPEARLAAGGKKF